MLSIQDSRGEPFPERSVVRMEQYDEARDALRQTKEQVINVFGHNELQRRLW